jgi:hypothetical protein
MKKENILRKLLFALVVPVLILACDNDDEPAALSVDFGSIASSSQEAEGQTITIPLRNANSGSVSKLGVVFGGSATEGDDYTLVGITEEGVQIKINDDQLIEDSEIIRVQLTGNGLTLNGNTIHNITIMNDCEDQGGLTLANFAAGYNATEKYGEAPSSWYGPYHVVITQDATNPNRFNMTDFYDSNLAAYFLVDIATKSIYFPNQTIGGKPLTASSGTFDFCTNKGHLTLTMQLNYDGGDWEYEFIQD